MASSLTYKKQLPGLRMEKQEHFLIKKREPSTLCVSGSPF